MAKLLQLSTLLLFFIVTACSSDDEQGPEYTGPWKIEYAEQFMGLHTSNPDFKFWFQGHLNDFEKAEFENYSHTTKATYSKENGDWIEWEDYSKWFYGTIEWSEIIYDASEDEIKAKIETFQSFSSDDGTQNGKFDMFIARYRKQPIE